MAAPNSEEIQQLKEFRDKLNDVDLRPEEDSDVFLLRWIRARDGNLDQAEDMLRQSLKWREENDIYNILNWKAPKTFSTLCPIKFLGYDKDNSPVIWIPFGTWNVRHINNIGERDNFIKYIDWLFVSTQNYMKNKTTSENYPVTKFVFIVDLNELSVLTVASFGAVAMILQSVRRFEANHPETMKACYFIYAGSVFGTLFSLMRPLLSEKTFRKMQILGTDPPVWEAIFKEQIPLDVLPKKYGGNSDILSTN